MTPNIRVPMTAEQERALFAARNDNLKPDEETDADQDQRSADGARDRCPQRRDDLRTANVAQRRAGEEVVVEARVQRLCRVLASHSQGNRIDCRVWQAERLPYNSACDRPRH